MPDQHGDTVRAVILGERKLCPHCGKVVDDGRCKFYFTVNDVGATGEPNELFLHMDESGSTLDGFADAYAIAWSFARQRHRPLGAMVKKFIGQRFAPSGLCEGGDIRSCLSIVDYVNRWINRHYKLGLE